VTRPDIPEGIAVQRGMTRYMRANSGECRILVRKADDIEAAVKGLRRFRDDLFTSELFASLDGQFGNRVDGTPVRYTPSYVSHIQINGDEPEFSFDAQDVLEVWPQLVNDLIEKLKDRLRAAGVQRAEIGKPLRPYSERAYLGESDWFHTTGSYLHPLDERWVPSNYPKNLPIPKNLRVVGGHQAFDLVSAQGRGV